ncbi:MAG: hypothetical protein ACREAA_20545 [Candidatus Polarisedimenticolia bacterium]
MKTIGRVLGQNRVSVSGVIITVICCYPLQILGVPADGVAVTCDAPVRETGSTLVLKLECEVRNESRSDVLIMASDATLDGPTDSEGYTPRLILGENHENVITISTSISQPLDRPSQFHGKADVSAADLGRLRRVGALTNVPLRARIALEHLEDIIMNKKVIVLRLKLEYIMKKDLMTVADGDAISRECKDEIKFAVSRPINQSEVVHIDSRAFPGAPRASRDGCHDVISSRFMSALSNTVQYVIPR